MRRGKLKDWLGQPSSGTRAGQLQSMADLVARAIHRSVLGDPEVEGWEELDEAERNDFRLAAHAAMGAHDAWLTMNGWVVVKLEEAAERERLLLPPAAALLGPDGKPIN